MREAMLQTPAKPSPSRAVIIAAGVPTLLVFGAASLMAHWSLVIDRKVQAELDAAWEEFRDTRCRSLGEAIGASQREKAMEYRCQGYALTLIELDGPPTAFLAREAHMVRFARCTARAEVLPWATACTDLAPRR